LREKTSTQRKVDVPEMLSMFSQPFYGKLGQNGPICKRYLIAKIKRPEVSAGTVPKTLWQPCIQALDFGDLLFPGIGVAKLT
jgi:hypothetical protein